MYSPAKTVQVFGGYLLALGSLLIVGPNTLLGLFGVPTTNEVWIRVVGMLAGILGYYYLRAAASHLVDFFAWTIPARVVVLPCFCVFVVLKLAPPVLILFGAIDMAGAAWTWSAINHGRTRG